MHVAVGFCMREKYASACLMPNYVKPGGLTREDALNAVACNYVAIIVARWEGREGEREGRERERRNSRVQSIAELFARFCDVIVDV